jgi:uncharacterized membrane protein YagU involved in acid resistance
MLEDTAELTRASARILWRTILLAGLAGAAVDAAYFTVKSYVDGVGPVRVLQSIAGFWLGKSAATGGAASAALGAATHLGLATIMAAGFVAVHRCFPMLRGSVVTMGAIYGLVLYAVMYGIVLPLRWPQIFPTFSGWTSVFDVLVHIAVGIAIAAVALPARR